MKLKVMTFNICHGADYGELLKINQSPNGPLCFGYELTEQLLTEEHAEKLIETWHKSVNLEPVADLIRRYDCDIIALNEVRGEGESPYYSNQAEILGQMTNKNFAYAKAVEFPGEGSYGTALLSRFPIKSCETIRIPSMEEVPDREPRCFLKAVLLVPEELTVFVSHFGGHPKEQELAVETFLTESDNITTPVLLMGDFNTTPQDGRLSRIYDTMKEAFEKENFFTFPSFHPVRKIDYIFAKNSSQLLHFSEQKVVTETVSDHYPLYAEILFE
ncbi:MAG: endonuclease/exonuclease/phosphatase family protein [Clostridia bacterium]|nr:endonuclease/exonuclease/phosphatase family protein [Clostridia bacterium]